MANPLQWRHTATGANLYFTIRNLAGAIWNTYGTPAFETLVPAHWYSAASNNYAIAMTESPTGSYLYTGTFPAIAGNMTAGWYWVDVFAQAGASPAISDTMVATLLGWWDGTTLKPNADDTVALAGTVQSAGRDLGVVLPGTALNNAPALTDYQQRNVAVTLPTTAPANWLNAAAFAAGVLPTRFGSLAIDTSGNVTLGGYAAGQSPVTLLASAFSTVNSNIALVSTNSRQCTVIIPEEFVIPASGSGYYWVDVLLCDADGNPLDADTFTPVSPAGGGNGYAIHVNANLMDGTSMNARFCDESQITLGLSGAYYLYRLSQGHYRAFLMVQSTDTEQPIAFSGAYVVGGQTKNFGGVVNLHDLTPTATLGAIKTQTDKIGTNDADSPNAQVAQAAVGNGTPGTLGGLATCSVTSAAGNPAVLSVVHSGDCFDLAAALVVVFDQVSASWNGDNPGSVTLYKTAASASYSSLWQPPHFTPPSGQILPPPLAPGGYYLYWSPAEGAWRFGYAVQIPEDRQLYYLGSTDPSNPAGTYVKQGTYGQDFTPPLSFPDVTVTTPTTITFAGPFAVSAAANNLPSDYLTAGQQTQLASAAGAQQAGQAVTLPAGVAQTSDLTALATTITSTLQTVPAGVAAMFLAAGLAEYVSGTSGPLRWTQPAMFYAGLTTAAAAQLGAAAAALLTAGPIEVVSPVVDRGNGEGPLVLKFFRGDSLAAATGRQITLAVGDSWAEYLVGGADVHLTIWRNSACAPGPTVLTMTGTVSTGPPATVTFTATHTQTMNLGAGRYSADLQVHLPSGEWFTVRSGVVDVRYAQFPDET